MNKEQRLDYIRARMRKPFTLNKAVVAQTKRLKAEIEEEEEEAGDGDDCPVLEPLDDSAPTVKRKLKVRTEDESELNDSVISPLMRKAEESVLKESRRKTK